MGSVINFGIGKRKVQIMEAKLSPVMQSEIDRLGYPFQTINRRYNPMQVMELYKRELLRGKENGFVPVIIAEDETLDEYFGILWDEDDYSVKDAIEGITDGRIVLRRMEQMLADDESESADIYEDIMGEMDEGYPINTFSSIFDYQDGSLGTCVILEVPTDKPWEVVAYVPFGGWNECPSPCDMASICKYWYEKYGAIPAVITHDTLEFYVERPVQEGASMELAKEHYIFCPDRVDQSTATYTIGEVADCLWQSRVWYFWWD